MLCTHYPTSGGASNRGTYCGAFCVAANSTDSNSAWLVGAALLMYTL